MVGEPQVAMRLTSQIWQVVFASQTLPVFCFSLRKKAQYVVVDGHLYLSIVQNTYFVIIRKITHLGVNIKTKDEPTKKLIVASTWLLARLELASMDSSIFSHSSKLQP